MNEIVSAIYDILNTEKMRRQNLCVSVRVQQEYSQLHNLFCVDGVERLGA
jgi:hypothetical protein